MSKPSRQKKILFTLVLCVCALQGVALIGYRLALMRAYVSFSRADLGVPPEFETQLSHAKTSALAQGRGAHLVSIMGCQDCHGQKLDGQLVSEEKDAWRVVAPDLRRPVFAEPKRRWAALRLGLDGDRRALWAMPRYALLGLAQTDVIALMAYLDVSVVTAEETGGTPSLPQNRLSLGGYKALLKRSLWLTDTTVPAPESGGWQHHPPAPTDTDFASYMGRVARCNSCHSQSIATDLPARGAMQSPPAQALNGLSQLAQQTTRPDASDTVWAKWVQRLREGRCPDGKDATRRGGPSRFAGLSDDEALGALVDLGRHQAR